MPGASSWLTFSLVLLGCSGPEAPTLRVDLRTDMRPAIEFDAIRVEIGNADLGTRLDPVVDAREDYLRGVRLGEAAVREGLQDVHVTLLRDGEEVVRRDTTAEVGRGFSVVTVVITRDCTGIECPATGDDPGLRSCLGGRCVDPRCTPETPEACPPGCAGDDECPSDGCIRGVCAASTCLRVYDDALCAAGELCDATGCTRVGMTDAGADVGTDTGVDVGIDAGTDVGTDAGIPGCPDVDRDTLFLFDFDTSTDRLGATGILDMATLTPGTSPCGGGRLQTAGTADAEGFFLIPASSAHRVAVGSLDFWARFPSPGATVKGVFSRDEEGTRTAGHMSLLRTSMGNLVLRLQEPPDTSRVVCSAPVVDSEWHRIGINFGAGGVEFWLDNVLQEAPGSYNFGGGVVLSCGGPPFEIGIDGNDNPFLFGASMSNSTAGGHEPVSEALHGLEIDHARLSRVRRDYASE